jgi:hypothetical protein
LAWASTIDEHFLTASKIFYTSQTDLAAAANLFCRNILQQNIQVLKEFKIIG